MYSVSKGIEIYVDTPEMKSNSLLEAVGFLRGQ